MKRILFAALAAFACVAAEPADDASKKDLEKMQGDWAAVSYVRDGTKFPDDEAGALFRTVEGQRYTIFRFRKPLAKGSFKIDAAKKPPTIDVTPANAAKDAKPVLGIYEFDGDKMKMCYAPPGRDRPTEFASPTGSGITLVVWEREKKTSEPRP